MNDLLEAILEAAVIEAQTNPRMVLTDECLYWRGPGGAMTRMTDHLPLNARVVSFTDNTVTWEEP